LLGVILILLVVMAIAAGIGAWKVRQLASSTLLIKEDTIFSLKAGTADWRWANSFTAKNH
jgi:hypothetical protein